LNSPSKIGRGCSPIRLKSAQVSEVPMPNIISTRLAVMMGMRNCRVSIDRLQQAKIIGSMDAKIRKTKIYIFANQNLFLDLPKNYFP